MHFLTCLKSKTMRNLLNLALVLLSTFLLFGCEKDELSTPNYPDQEYGITGGTRPGKPTSTAGNNLSFPVIWAEGVEKTLPGTDGMVPALNGDFWWWWGIEGVDPNTTIIHSCVGDPFSDVPACLSVPETPGDNDELVKVFAQKDANNIWLAYNEDWSYTPVVVNSIDWGDNLESVDWYINSKVRTEVVLFKNNLTSTPWLEYQMRHVFGWGTTELHGLAYDHETDQALLGDGMLATVYSHCARFTIQKLNVVDLNDPLLEGLEWDPATGWFGHAANSPLFNKAVYEGGDGPGYYSAETNIKGRIIYGYTWNVKQMNDGPGYYRLTFSFDDTAGPAGPALNTYFVAGTTGILQPVEEETLLREDGTGGGGVAQIDFDNNLTYIDIQILDRVRPGGGGGPH